MLVQCRHRGDHMTNRSRPHGPSQCPPPQGKRGDRYRSLHAKRDVKIEPLAYNIRGVAVTGMHGGKAAKHRAGIKKAVVD